MTPAQSHVRFRVDSSLDLRVLRQNRTNPQLGCPDAFEGVVTDPVSLHKYVYANGNPVTNTDPSGRISVTEGLVTFGVAAVVNATVSVISGERNPWKIIANATIAGGLAVATGGLMNGVTTHVTNVFIRTMGVSAIAGATGFTQSVISPWLMNEPNGPIDYDRAIAAGIVSAVAAGLFGAYAGDRYDSGEVAEEGARKVYDLVTAVASEGLGTSADAIYDWYQKLKANGVFQTCSVREYAAGTLAQPRCWRRVSAGDSLVR